MGTWDVVSREAMTMVALKFNRLLEASACEHLDIPTLRMRSLNRLDFYDVAVWCFQPALLEAFEVVCAESARLCTAPCPRWVEAAGTARG